MVDVGFQATPGRGAGSRGHERTLVVGDSAATVSWGIGSGCGGSFSLRRLRRLDYRRLKKGARFVSESAHAGRAPFPFFVKAVLICRDRSHLGQAHAAESMPTLDAGNEEN